MKLEVITYQIWRELKLDKEDVVITVSKAKDWSQGLSPFILGPCELYDGYTAKNVENTWQFSKAYKEHLDKDGNVGEEYFRWASNGWNDDRAHRYPMGKGAIPEFSYWDGECLSYVEARKKIYIPIYYSAVKDTSAFATLKEKYEEYKKADRDLYLVDFDAYRHKELGMTYRDVINCESRKMGHSFILGMALECPIELERSISQNSF